MTQSLSHIRVGQEGRDGDFWSAGITADTADNFRVLAEAC